MAQVPKTMIARLLKYAYSSPQAQVGGYRDEQ